MSTKMVQVCDRCSIDSEKMPNRSHNTRREQWLNMTLDNRTMDLCPTCHNVLVSSFLRNRPFLQTSKSGVIDFKCTKEYHETLLVTADVAESTGDESLAEMLRDRASLVESVLEEERQKEEYAAFDPEDNPEERF